MAITIEGEVRPVSLRLAAAPGLLCGSNRWSARRRVSYDEWISSPAWLRSPARLEELEASGHRCRLCYRAPPLVRLEVHHRTYLRIGRERADDLTTLCSDCHLLVTGELRSRRRPVPLPLPTDCWICTQSFTPVASEWVDADGR